MFCPSPKSYVLAHWLLVITTTTLYIGQKGLQVLSHESTITANVLINENNETVLRPTVFEQINSAFCSWRFFSLFPVPPPFTFCDDRVELERYCSDARDRGRSRNLRVWETIITVYTECRGGSWNQKVAVLKTMAIEVSVFVAVPNREYRK